MTGLETGWVGSTVVSADTVGFSGSIEPNVSTTPGLTAGSEAPVGSRTSVSALGSAGTILAVASTDPVGSISSVGAEI